MTHDIRLFIETAEDQGWTVKKLKSGHWQFIPADKTKRIVVASGTPSDYRSIKNLRSDLRRNGLVLAGLDEGSTFGSILSGGDAERTRTRAMILSHYQDAMRSYNNFLREKSVMEESASRVVRWGEKFLSLIEQPEHGQGYAAHVREGMVSKVQAMMKQARRHLRE